MQRLAETRERFDVAIVGGGAAGVAAAVSAARLGARSVLLERAESLGGNISQALVHTLCGLYLPADLGDATPANPGFPRHFEERLRAEDAAGTPQRAGRVWVLPTEPPRVAESARRICDAAAGLEVRTGCELIAAELPVAGERDARLRVRRDGEGEAEIAAGAVVDASGDAAAARLAGAETEMADPGERQLPSYIFRLGDVDTQALEELRGFERMRVTSAIAGAVRSGDLPAGCEAVLVRPSFEEGHVYVTLNLPREAQDDSPHLDGWARERAERLIAFLRRTREAFEKCRVDAWPQRVGIRETRRVLGRNRVTANEVREGQRGADEIALASWPIELWQDHRKARLEYPSGPSSVPLGALISRSHARLAMAGRCLSADREALGSLRVLGTAMATGEAAGIAAAIAVDSGIPLSAVAPERVRHQILDYADGVPRPR